MSTSSEISSSRQSTSSNHSSSFSFAQGFILGQISVVVLIFAFIKYFVFGDLSSDDANSSRSGVLARPKSRRSSLSVKRSRSVLQPATALTTATILSKTFYNVNGHQSESLDWFNVLVAQTIAQFRADAQADEAILERVTEMLNGDKKPDWLDEIKVTELSLGDDYPIFSSCRIIREDGRAGEDGTLQARIDVDLSDSITLGMSTKMVLNFPSPRAAVLPIEMVVEVVKFSGTLSLSFIPSSPPKPNIPPDGTAVIGHTRPLSSSCTSEAPPHSPTTLSFSFLPDYRLELSIRSLLGSRSRLQDIPKIAKLVEARLHAWLDERCVEPRFQQIVLPSLWPRQQNTRGGEEDDNDIADAGDLGSKGRTENRERDTMREAREEVEREMEAARVRMQRERILEEQRETMRRRSRSAMPGGLPGVSMT